MLGHIDKIYESSIYLVPIVCLAIGFITSLHCVGMCGGLVLSVAKTRSDIYKYQLGRLSSYILLASIASVLGSFIMVRQLPDWAKVLPALILGIVLISWGVLSLRKRSLSLTGVKGISKIINLLWVKALKLNPTNNLKSFLIGTLSVFLPCAMLYSVIFAIASFNTLFVGVISILFFWIGTLPAMVFAPDLIRKLASKVNINKQYVFGYGAIVVGVCTILYRLDMIMNVVVPYCENIF